MVLSEKSLSVELGVSRTPGARGDPAGSRARACIVVYAQSGTIVSKIDLDQVEEARFVRSALECAALADAGEASDADIRDLQAILARQREFEASQEGAEWSAFFALDEELHRKLTQISGHPLVWDVITAARVHMDRVRRLSMPFSQRIPEITTIAQVDHGARADRLRRGRTTTRAPPRRPWPSTCPGSPGSPYCSPRELPDYFDPAPDTSTADPTPGQLDKEGRTQ